MARVSLPTWLLRLPIGAKPTRANISSPKHASACRTCLGGSMRHGEYRALHSQPKISLFLATNSTASRDKRASGAHRTEYEVHDMGMAHFFERRFQQLIRCRASQPSLLGCHLRSCRDGLNLVISFAPATRPEPSNARPRPLGSPRLQYNHSYPSARHFNATSSLHSAL